jgi:uncharacterized protein YjbJ (UPF0337 family)
METSELVDLTEEKGRLKQKFASLTDDDLLFDEGKREELFGRHQFRLGQTENEYDKFIPML